MKPLLRYVGESVQNSSKTVDSLENCRTQPVENRRKQPVEDCGPVGKQTVEVILVDTLGEESDYCEELSGIGAEFLEHGRSEGEFDSGR